LKKFKCTVTREYEYEIEFDESVWNEKELKEWSSFFQDVDDLEDLAEILAERKTRYNEGEFIEGFGIPMINGKKPYVFGNPNPDIEESVNINIISESYVSVDVDEITE
jgi:hypothetical protein